MSSTISIGPLTHTLPAKLMRRVLRFTLFAIVLLSATLTFAQTSSFTYQGRFTDGGTAANGVYDMQFKLFDSSSVGTGNQLGSTITNGAVAIVNGVFTVQLNFGSPAFSGPDRFLELGVRPAGASDPYTIMSPRQQLTSAVYAIRASSAATADAATSATTATSATNADSATNSTQLGGVAASQYVLTSDPRLTVSGNFIQNTTSQQASSNFNISGDGTAGGTLTGNAINSATHYDIAANRVFAVNGAGSRTNSNTIAGVGAGTSITPSSTNVPGNLNSFFGWQAGNATTLGDTNSMFGAEAGMSNIGGYSNSFFGALAGGSNTGGFQNSFFGMESGFNNTTGSANTFIGIDAGHGNTTGHDNVFVGYGAGSGIVTGDTNTMIGSHANVVFGAALTNATAIGAEALVSQSNSLVLGANANVGIGTTAPAANLHIAANGGNILLGNAGCFTGFVGFGFAATLTCTNYSVLGNGSDTIINRPTGGIIDFRENNNPQMTIAAGGAVTINTLGGAGSTSLCRNASNQISTCSSSLRYKTNVQPFRDGLSVLNRLHPIAFDWRLGGMRDLGFGAEDVAAVEPLLVTRNDKGEVEGVKYDRLTAVLVNAVKEQQQQITQQLAQIKRQQNEIENLKQVVCRRNHRAATCK
jgi:hypothetical protein